MNLMRNYQGRLGCPTHRVTVLIDTYNHERFIEQAVSSVLAQDFPRDQTEVIVVDDGSTDQTIELLRKFGPAIRIINKRNGGQASAFNVGIESSTGEIVAFLDGDDWWVRTKLSKVVDAFEKNPEIAAVGHGYFEVPEVGAPSEMIVANETCFIDMSSVQAAKVATLGRTLLATSRLSVRREVLKKIGPIPETFVFCADAPILTMCFVLGGAIVLDDPLCYYRIHSGSLFTHSSPNDEKALRKADMLAMAVGYLKPRFAERGVSTDVANIVLESYQIEADRLRLTSGGRGRINSAVLEIREFRNSYRQASLQYKLFKAAVALLAGVLPPKWFYSIREWYSRNRLHRLRERLAEADSNASVAPFRRSGISAAKSETDGKEANGRN
jgi:glycosyltransferase involved in cell wall biosynthesis